MSRLGKKPVFIPSNVQVVLEDALLSVKGPKGVLALPLPKVVSIAISPSEVLVSPNDMGKAARSCWGMVRSILANLVKGVTEGFQKKILIVGVGYRAQLKKEDGREVLQLALGYSHDVFFPLPEEVFASCPKPTEIVLSSIDKQLLGQVASEICSLRPHEPYKGKGLRCEGAEVFRKEAKKK